MPGRVAVALDAGARRPFRARAAVRSTASRAGRGEGRDHRRRRGLGVAADAASRGRDGSRPGAAGPADRRRGCPARQARRASRSAATSSVPCTRVTSRPRWAAMPVTLRSPTRTVRSSRVASTPSARQARTMPVEQRRVELGNRRRGGRVGGGKRDRGAHRARIEVHGAAAGEPAPHPHAVAGAGSRVDLPVGALEAADHHGRAGCARRSASAPSPAPAPGPRPTPGPSGGSHSPAAIVRAAITARAGRRGAAGSPPTAARPASSSTSSGSCCSRLGQARSRRSSSGPSSSSSARTPASRSAATAAAAGRGAVGHLGQADQLERIAAQRLGPRVVGHRRGRIELERRREQRVGQPLAVLGQALALLPRREPGRLDPAAGGIGVVAVGSHVRAGRLGQLGKVDRPLPRRHERALRDPFALELAGDRLDLSGHPVGAGVHARRRARRHPRAGRSRPRSASARRIGVAQPLDLLGGLEQPVELSRRHRAAAAAARAAAGAGRAMRSTRGASVMPNASRKQ